MEDTGDRIEAQTPIYWDWILDTRYWIPDTSHGYFYKLRQWSLILKAQTAQIKC